MSETAKTDKSSPKNIYGDPPKINFNLPEISELTQNFKSWKDVQLPIDILLLTVKDCEFLSCYHYIVDPFRSYFKGLGSVYFGSFGEDQDDKLKVALMKCSEGSKFPVDGLTVVKNAVTQLRPKAVFSVGHFSGINQESTKLGDVVLSKKLTTYSYQKVTKDGKKFCGFTTPVSREIAELINCAGHGWNPPLENPKERKVEVLCGEVLSGTEVMHAEWRQEELMKSFPEAIAIETEGEGVFSAAHELKIEWVIVKGISGYADGTEGKENWQTFASVTSASLVANILNQCSIFEDWPHYKGDSTKHLPRPEVKRRKEESSSNDALTPKKGKTCLAGGSTKRFLRPKMKRCHKELSPSDASTPMERVKQGVPSDEDLERLSQKLDNWKTVGRRLEIEEARLTAFDNENREWSEKIYKMLLHWKERNGSAATYMVLHDALCHSLVNRKDLAEQFITGDSTKHLRRPKVKRHDEESSPNDALTPKKGKTRVAGGSTKHSPQPKVKGRDEESSPSDASILKERGGSTKHLPPPKVKRRYEESSPSDALTPKKRDSSVTEFLEWCQKQLRTFYTDTMCQVKITPWNPDDTVHINDIYIQLTFLQDHRKPDGTTKKRLGDSSEVFEGDEHHPIRRRILVYGRPGIGKSTFTQKVAVDWANGQKKILKKFALLLLIRLRDVCDSRNVCAMLKTAELLSADKPKAVDNLYEYVLQNQEKVLLILDGYDEYSGGKASLIYHIWRGSQLRDCCVMITSRPVKEDELRVSSHAQFELNGFDSLGQKTQFASKILRDEEDVKGLLEYLEKHDLMEMAEIPLLLLMLCLLWKQKKHQLPTSRAEIFAEFIQTLLDHMATKDSENVATNKSIEEYQEELCKIGKLAFDALLEDCLYVNFSKCLHGDLFEKLIHIGFFQVSKLSALNREKMVYFLHKSVQEFLAAWFIVQELKVKKNETVTYLSGMDTLEKLRNMAEVLKFVCELSSDAACIVFDHLHRVGENEGLTNCNFTRTPSVEDLSFKQRNFIRLCVDCLFCSASDRPAVYSAFLSCVNHVVILDWKHLSIAAKTHFFKDTTSFPNYLFHFVWWTNYDNFLTISSYDDFPSISSYDDFLSISFDLNAVVLTCSGEIEDVKKYADLGGRDFFLKKSEERNFIYLCRITDVVFHSKLLSELISAPVCSSQPPVDNLGKNEDNNIALSLTENKSDQTQQHCLSLVRKVQLRMVTIEDFVLLKNLLPLLTALRVIDIWGGVTDALKGNSIKNAIHRINFTDNLHSLKLCGINLTAKCAAFIAESLHHSPNLHELCLSSNPLHSGVSHLAKNLHHTPRLTILELVRVQMGEKECAALAASLQYLNKLEELDMSKNALGHGIIELAKNLNSVPNLTKLNLSNTNMGKDEASALARALKDVPELSDLDMTRNALGHGIIELAKNLNSVRNLTKLNLSNTNMGEDEASALARALKDVPELSDLDMNHNALGHGIIELAKNLNSVPNLTKLNLSFTNMGKDEASALARALKDVPELIDLDLRWNPLGRGVRDLVQHLSSVPKLKKLSLFSVQMTETEIEELCTEVKGRGITLFTDYHENEIVGDEWVINRLTKAELKKKGIRFRKEPDDDDDDDDDDDGDDDDESEDDDHDDDDDDDENE